jgi:xanthine dehydrogenase YagS FAD-binding subunit
MDAFAYAAPANLHEAIELLSPKWGEAEILAGGTDLLSLMKDYISVPKHVVNIKNISELRGIDEDAGGYRIGSLTTLEDLVSHKGIRESLPALHQAAAGVTSPQIRKMGTVGGDLLQRPRCWYYRAGYGLLALDSNGHSLVPGGDNRYHAILGNEGPAYFVSPSSLAPALIALDASVRLHGPSGAHEVSVEKFFVTPKTAQEREHAIKPDELLTEILIPASAREWRNATYEVRQREALDWPLTTASIALKIFGGRVSAARVVLGHVAPVPWRSFAAESALEGKTLNDSTAREVGEVAVNAAKPLSHNGYKVQLARVAASRALLALKEGT